MSNFLRNRQTDFQSGYTSLQSPKQWRTVPLSPHPRQHLLSSEFLILAIPIDVRWNLRVVLLCISLMIKDVEHFFRCFSAIRYSSGENSLFSSEPHFLMGLVLLLLSLPWLQEVVSLGSMSLLLWMLAKVICIDTLDHPPSSISETAYRFPTPPLKLQISIHSPGPFALSPLSPHT